ncbi:hypothetical protein MMC21_006208 [Puttea exsequens]|nr:hypothetical protein [Puttea exsequens]
MPRRRRTRSVSKTQKAIAQSSIPPRNIDLPAWWVLFLQSYENEDHRKSRSRVQVVGEKLSGALQGIFLDFLYPLQTIALIRRLRQSTTLHNEAAFKSRKSRNALSNIKLHSRKYTSIAEAVIAGENAAKEEVQDQVQEEADIKAPRTAKSPDELRSRISELLNLGNRRYYDELWGNYQDLIESSQSLSSQETVRLLQALSKSDRTQDSERCMALFESVPVVERRAIHYSHTIPAALSLEDTEAAFAMFHEAKETFGGSVGTSALMSYTIQNELWQQAISIWHEYWRQPMLYYASPQLWTGVDELPLSDFMDLANAAADFALSMGEVAQNKESAAARDFANELFRRCFSRGESNFILATHWSMAQKAFLLNQSDSEIPSLALRQLISVNTRGHDHGALRLYRDLRQRPDYAPTKQVLDAITERVLTAKSNSGVFMVIQDWRGYFQVLPARVGVRCIHFLAENGQLEATKNLFEELRAEHGPPKSNSMYHALLIAHKGRADTNGVVRTFESLIEEHGFEPGTQAYNIVIQTFTRAGDIDGALQWFEKLFEKNLQPNERTFSIMMTLYGERGDTLGIQELYQLSREKGLQINASVVGNLVQANIYNDDLVEAERLVKESSKMKLTGIHTVMWNRLLNAHALRKNVHKVAVLQKDMQEAGIHFDSATYAALMSSLSVAKEPRSAYKILRIILPRENIRQTALHYAIVMGGFMATKQPDMILQLYKEMTRRDIAPTMGTHQMLLKSAAAFDEADKNPEVTANRRVDYTRAQEIFDQVVSNIDPAELASSAARRHGPPEPMNEAFTSTYFEYMILLYGKERSFDKVTELYDQFLATTSKYTTRDIEAAPPIRMLSALMVAHRHANSRADIQRCWDLALKSSISLACSANISRDEPGWVLPARRYILNLPLRQYILSLSAQNPVFPEDITILRKTIAGLHSAGYALTSSNWNLYIQVLARSANPKDHIVAFSLCETHLLRHWPGWSALGHPASYRRKMHAMMRNSRLVPDYVMPEYTTFVWLARCWVEARKRRKGVTGEEFVRAGKRTVDAVCNMPRLEDLQQSEILRGSTVPDLGNPDI